MRQLTPYPAGASGRLVFVPTTPTIAVQTGLIDLELGEHEDALRTLRLRPGDSVHLLPGVRHRITAVSDEVVLLEASTTELDDVVRLADRYGRQGTSRP